MEKPESYRILLWLVAAGFFMQTLDSTIVNTALPAMAASLGESPLRMQSVVISYALIMAILIPISGWMADRFGTRKTYLGAILVFALGSLLCALSRTLSELVMARIVQGSGGAMLLPVGRLAVLRAVPRDKFLSAMSFVTIPGLIGPLIGPTLGGWLVQFTSWHWIFIINLPVGIIGCLATLKFMPEFHKVKAAPLDVSGFFLLAFSMAAISIALDGLAELGLPAAFVLVLLIFGLASLTAYWLHALKRPQSLFPLKLFETDTYRIGLLGNLFARFGSGSMPFLLPLMLQTGLNLSPFEAGLMMIPTAIAGILSKRFGTDIIERLGYRNVLVGNTLIVGLAMASFALFSPHQPDILRYIQLAVFGAVNSLQFTAMNTVSLKDLDSSLASSGNGLLSMVQMLSMSLGVAGAGGLLAVFTRQLGTAHSQDILKSFHWTFICVGLVTAASACIFWQLEKDVTASRACDEVEIEMG